MYYNNLKLFYVYYEYVNLKDQKNVILSIYNGEGSETA